MPRARKARIPSARWDAARRLQELNTEEAELLELFPELREHNRSCAQGRYAAPRPIGSNTTGYREGLSPGRATLH